MNILVTGATGFIGRHLVERLTREGGHLRALVRPETDASALATLGVEVARGDVRDYPAVERATAGCHLVFHLAAKIESLALPRKVVQAVNVQGTANVARAAVQAGVGRLVLCSSVGVYGRVVKNLAIDEDTETKPDSPYGESKVLAERTVLSYRERDGLPVVVARVTSVFGPGSKNWVGLFQAIASGRFRLIGPGDNHYHLADVADVVEGLVLCGSVPGAEGRTYIIAGGEPVRLRELVRMIGEEVGVPRFPASLPAGPLRLYKTLNKLAYAWGGHRLPRADRIDFFLGDRVFDISRGRKELGYAPKVSLREAVRRMAEWYREQGYLVPG
jgi:nucleoside-diphosphate-sugar epimerase